MANSQPQKGIISYSLYGSDHRYTLGAIANAIAAKLHYPGWRAVFWCVDVPENIMNGIEGFGGIIRDIPRGVPPMFARFMVTDTDPDSPFIIRDADSRLSQREAGAVREWLDSDFAAHAMIDHPAHTGRALNGGMWGCKPGILGNMLGLIQAWQRQQKDRRYSGHDDDQNFLAAFVWPRISGKTMIHTSFLPHEYPNARPFPGKRDGHRFVGEVWVYDVNGNEYPRDDDWRAIPIEM